jgi:hypothetical protein
MPEVVKVPGAALHAMTSRWQGHTVELAAGGAPVGGGVSGQPSAVSMSAVRGGIGGASTRLSTRTETSATKVSLAKAGFDANEDASAAKLLDVPRLV